MPGDCMGSSIRCTWVPFSVPCEPGACRQAGQAGVLPSAVRMSAKRPSLSWMQGAAGREGAGRVVLRRLGQPRAAAPGGPLAGDTQAQGESGAECPRAGPSVLSCYWGGRGDAGMREEDTGGVAHRADALPFLAHVTGGMVMCRHSQRLGRACAWGPGEENEPDSVPMVICEKTHVRVLSSGFSLPPSLLPSRCPGQDLPACCWGTGRGRGTCAGFGGPGPANARRGSSGRGSGRMASGASYGGRHRPWQRGAGQSGTPGP